MSYRFAVCICLVFFLDGCFTGGRLSRAKVFPAPTLPSDLPISHAEGCRGKRYLTQVPVLVGNMIDFVAETYSPDGKTSDRYISKFVSDINIEVPQLSGIYFYMVDRAPNCVTVFLTIELNINTSNTRCWMDAFPILFSQFNFPSLFSGRVMNQIDHSHSEQLNRDFYLKYLSIDSSKFIGNYVLVTKKKCGKGSKAETVEYTAIIEGAKTTKITD